jgi:hypothetical protein
MAYHPLAQDTAQTPERRREEAEQLLSLLQPHYNEMMNHEQKFWSDMQQTSLCSPKQLFWLRDLRDKYC